MNARMKMCAKMLFNCTFSFYRCRLFSFFFSFSLEVSFFSSAVSETVSDAVKTSVEWNPITPIEIIMHIYALNTHIE